MERCEVVILRNDHLDTKTDIGNVSRVRLE